MFDLLRTILRAVIVMIATGLVFGYDPGLTTWFTMPWRVGWVGTLLALTGCGVALDALYAHRVRAALTDVELSLREFVRDVEAAYDEDDREGGGALDDDWYDIARTYEMAKVRLEALDDLKGKSR